MPPFLAMGGVQNKGNLPANIRLLNIVWDYDCDEYHVEEKEGLEYIREFDR